MISIIIPTYNRARTIDKSIRSVLSQSYTDIELLVIDDGSTDNTEEVVKNIKDNRLRYIYQENAGACAARNNGIKNARGDYIAFHDSDDICRTDRINKQLEVLLNENADMVCARTCGHSDDKTYVEPKTQSSFLTNINLLCGISATTFFAKKRVFLDIMFDEEMPRWQDLEILTRIYSNYRLFLADDVVVDGYEQTDSISCSPQKCVSAFELIMKKHPEISNEQTELYYYLLNLYARSKAQMNRKDCIEDFRIIYRKKKDIRSLIWYLASKVGMAGLLFQLLK